MVVVEWNVEGYTRDKSLTYIVSIIDAGTGCPAGHYYQVFIKIDQDVFLTSFFQLSPINNQIILYNTLKKYKFCIFAVLSFNYYFALYRIPTSLPP